jgi:hypothetical protein
MTVYIDDRYQAELLPTDRVNVAMVWIGAWKRPREGAQPRPDRIL